MASPCKATLQEKTIERGDKVLNIYYYSKIEANIHTPLINMTQNISEVNMKAPLPKSLDGSSNSLKNVSLFL